MRHRDHLSALFRRETSSGTFLPEIDGVRCIALLGVLLHHVTASYLETTGRFGALDLPRQWWEVFPKATTIATGYAGHFGVHLFFVISGFILALPYVEHYRGGAPRPRLGAYYLRRLVRIEPPYVINLLVAFALICWMNEGWREFVPHLGASLFYLHGPVYAGASWINGVAWSLEVEVQFYLLVPLLAYLLAPSSARLRHGVLLALVLALAFVAQRFLTAADYPRLHVSLANQLQFFLAGFLLADLYQADAPRAVRWDGAALASCGLIYFILTQRYGYYWLTPVLVLVLYQGLLRGVVGAACLRNRWVSAIGGMCYTIYLYHFLMLDLLAPYTMQLSRPDIPLPLDLLLQCILLLPPILLLSAGLFLSVEKPFMRLSRMLARRLSEPRQV